MYVLKLFFIMSEFDFLSVDQRKNAFLNTLADTQKEFIRKGIDFRIIGSLASHAYLEPEIEAVAPLCYNRKGVATADQLVPDIDLIVPRADLPAAREIRKKTIHGHLPVKLGLAIPTTEIDFRPTEDVSFLTHKNIALPVDNELFRIEEEVQLDEQPIQTIPLDTLIHTYGTFGGRVRGKDLPVLKALIRQIDTPSDPRTKVFHEFQKMRRKTSPNEHFFALTVEALMEKAPYRLRNEMYRVALVGADLLDKR